MARPYRLQAEDCFYHITSRGNGRKKIFLNNTDFEKFLEYILKAKEKYDFYLLAYVLMSNHYHLRRKTGHLFQGRYKSLVIDEDSYFQELTRYIHLNPVRAKMVKNPEDYRWSSYNAYVGRKRKDRYIDKEEIRKYLGMESKNYRFFVLNGMLTGEKEDDIFRDVYGGFLLGKAQFIKEKLKELKTQAESDKISYSKELHLGIEPGVIIEEVARRFKKNPQDLIDSKKRPAIEKQAAIYLIRRHTGLTNGEIGKIFKM